MIQLVRTFKQKTCKYLSDDCMLIYFNYVKQATLKPHPGVLVRPIALGARWSYVTTRHDASSTVITVRLTQADQQGQ